MLHIEIISVCSEIHTKHKYTVWAERRIYNVPRSNHTPVSAIKTSQLMLYTEIIAVFFRDPHKTHKYTVWAERRIYNVPRSKHTPVSAIKTSQLMLYTEIIAVFFLRSTQNT